MHKATILSLYPYNLISGVGRVSGARGQKMFLRFPPNKKCRVWSEK